MTDGSRVLLEPACPLPEDSGMRRLGEILLALTGARWGILTIWQESWHRECRYVLGAPEGSGREVVIVAKPGLRAGLQLNEEAEVTQATVARAAFLVEQEMTNRQLGRQVRLLQGALDGTSSAVFLFDRRADIVYANPPADRMLTQQTENDLAVVEGEKGLVPLMELLCSWVADAVAAHAPASTVRHEIVTISDGTILACEVQKIATDDYEEPGVLVLLQPVTTAPDIRLEILAKKYGLSARERDVLKLLARGLRTVEIAETMCISPHTVRDHIKRLYRKTGLSSRGRLLNLLANGGSSRLTGPAG